MARLPWLASLLAGSAHAQCTESTFINALPQGVSIENITDLPNGGNYSEGAANLGYGGAIFLPPVCVVTVSVTSGPSHYRFGLFLPPPDVWNQKFLAVGNEAQGGGINWPQMGQGPHYQMATLSTDTGHNSIGSDFTWGVDQDRLLDWGYRALNGSLVLGKALTEVYYGKPITRSYWSGCSTGGRQGLKQIQIAPDSFDGVLIGAPAWDTKHLFPWITRIVKLNLGSPNPLGPNQFSTLAYWATVQCGDADGIIMDPFNCQFNLSITLCDGGVAQPPYCLTADQIEIARLIYGDYLTGSDPERFVAHGLPPGSEGQWSTYLVPVQESADFAVGYERYWLYGNDPTYTLSRYNDSAVNDSETRNPGQATADDFDLTGYRGKVILYHGLADGVVQPTSSGQYYNATRDAMGNIDSFFKLFYVPGLQHCWLPAPYSPGAPWQIGGAGQAVIQQQYFNNFGQGYSVPGFEKNGAYDALVALMEWAEGTRGDVQQIVATAWNSTGQPFRQRLVCAWPKQARFDGGDRNSASNWTCA
ncbi:tannase and feruloyl esterase [Podospora australis]|uniref:Carboxylic ester hydrolase n=1 Tax=Podospora australis TaxID=1536484 RepID=A0AAN6X155_9PEZI|nr:tannase and feruloyl esterase [Podospora australis]